MAYARSIPLLDWLGPRRDTIQTLEAAYGMAAGIDGPGRPSPAARPLAHAYTLGVVAEFQGFLRALHDLAVERWMVTAVEEDRLRPQVEAAAVQDRSLDGGNATVRGITDDFGRIGLRGLSGKLKNGNPKWDPDPGRGDMAEYNDLTALRNALAHGNERQVGRLRQKQPPVLDTLGWTRDRLPGLTRTARVLDRVVWDHLSATLQTKPW